MDSMHADTIRKLQRQIREYYARKIPFRVYHGSTNSTRVLTFKRSEMVDISEMGRVLSVDTTKRVAIVEPNVPMDTLVDETLKYGLIPPVVTEFPGITVGGAIQGAAAETSSHKWGCFSQTVNWIEMILGNGELIRASPSLNADLFYGTAGSYGSLGLITAAEIKLIPAKKYVTITHFQVTSSEDALRLANKYVKSSDFIECGMSQKDLGTVVIGNLSDIVEGRIKRFTRAHDPWYYLYAEEIMNAGKQVTDTVPLKDYLFRLDRGAFWTARLAFERTGMPFNAFTRFIFDPLMHTRKLYQAVQESAAAQEYVCQDIVLPTKSVVPFLEFIDKEFGLYPIIFCPIKPEPRSPLQCNGIDTELVFNIGVYGLRVTPYEKFVEINRQIESKTSKLGGKKWFYAHSYYSEDEFWQIYDKKWYNKLRKKYHATTLPDIYARTCVKERYHMNTKRAIYKIILGKAKLRIVD